MYLSFGIRIGGGWTIADDDCVVNHVLAHVPDLTQSIWHRVVRRTDSYGNCALEHVINFFQGASLELGNHEECKSKSKDGHAPKNVADLALKSSAVGRLNEGR